MRRPKYLVEIMNSIYKYKEGHVFTSFDFALLANQDVVNKALSRLNEQGLIKRLTQGVYQKPFKENNFEKDFLTIDSAAKAIARKFGWNICPSGSTALTYFGISNEPEKEWVYVSSGPYRSFIIGDKEIVFKHSSNKYFNGLSEKTRIVVQAIRHLGEYASLHYASNIAKFLSSNERAALLREGALTTAWVFEIIKYICK